MVRRKLTFEFELLPNDMKHLAYIADELTISASYFSLFANVKKDNLNDLKGKFGTENSTKWKPWKYSDRLKVFAAVHKKKTRA